MGYQSGHFGVKVVLLRLILTLLEHHHDTTTQAMGVAPP